MANLEELPMTKNDSLPSLKYTVTRSGSGSTTPNLAGFTVTIKVRKTPLTTGSTNVFTRSVTTSSGSTNGYITSATSANVLFNWSTGDWSSTGTYIAEISFASSAGKIETSPDRQTINVTAEF